MCCIIQLYPGRNGGPDLVSGLHPGVLHGVLLNRVPVIPPPSTETSSVTCQSTLRDESP